MSILLSSKDVPEAFWFKYCHGSALVTFGTCNFRVCTVATHANKGLIVPFKALRATDLLATEETSLHVRAGSEDDRLSARSALTLGFVIRHGGSPFDCLRNKVQLVISIADFLMSCQLDSASSFGDSASTHALTFPA